MANNELKPCPFCGGQPEKNHETLDERCGYANAVTIECPSCGASKGAMGDTSKCGYADNSTTEMRAIAEWNRRAAAPAQGELSDALPKLPEPYAGKHVPLFTEDQMRVYGLLCRGQQGGGDAACKWTLTDEDNGIWESSCGEAWSFVDGGPVENSVRFCQGCGKPTQVAAIQAQASDAPMGGA